MQPIATFHTGLHSVTDTRYLAIIQLDGVEQREPGTYLVLGHV